MKKVKTVFNRQRERVFDITEDEDGIPLLEIKTGKGKNAFRYIDAGDAIVEIRSVIKDR